MRVISGSAKRLLLKTIEGNDTRPTTDRIKETLFNMLQSDVADSDVLDLFSGSGGIGIEALSRGAGRCVFVENNPKAVECIRENLKTTHLSDKSVLMACDVKAALLKLDGQKKSFDLIFMDPPYQAGYEEEILTFLAGSSLVNPYTQIIVEAALETSFDFVEELNLIQKKEKRYKTNKHVFIEMGE